MATVYLKGFAVMDGLQTTWPGLAGNVATYGTGEKLNWEMYDQFVGVGVTGNLSGNSPYTGTLDRAVYSTGSPLPEFDIIFNTPYTMSLGTAQLLVNGNLAAFFTDLLAGADVIHGSRNTETLVGFGGNDVLIGGAGADTLIGGSGINTASYATAKAAVIVDWLGASSGDAQGDTWTGIQNLLGSRFNDRLYANDNANRLTGGLGNDTLVGRLGADTLDGGAGVDTASYDASFDPVIASLLNPALNTDAAAGDKYISIENIAGGTYDDTLYGNNSANRVEGNNYPAGNIVDDDKLFGLGGNDSLFGYRGDDRLTGGTGKDSLTGGLGRDIFDFNLITESVVGANRDFITDFTRGTNVTGDDIDLSTIDARTTLGGNQAFSWRGTLAFTKVEGQLRFIDQGLSCLVQGDVNGDGKADFEIMVKAATLGIGDFIL